MKIETKEKILYLLSQGHQQHCWLRSGAMTGTCTCVVGRVETLLSEEDTANSKRRVLNLNDMVQVQLTAHGITVFTRWAKDVSSTSPSARSYLEKMNLSSPITFCLHELFNIFGVETTVGSPNQVFENNEIELLDQSRE